MRRASKGAEAYVAVDMRDDGGFKVLAAPLFFPVDFTKVGVMMAGQALSPINLGKGDTLLVDPRQFAGPPQAQMLRRRLRPCLRLRLRIRDCDRRGPSIATGGAVQSGAMQRRAAQCDTKAVQCNAVQCSG